MILPAKDKKLFLIADDLERLAIWHNPSYSVKDLEKEILNYASMLKATAREYPKLHSQKHRDTQVQWQV